MTQQASNGKIGTEQFFKQALAQYRKLHPEVKSKGLHSVFSGFNESLREYFELDKAGGIAAMNALVEAGKVVSVVHKRGPMFYLPNEAPISKLTVKSILAAQV